jgi:hypothetical protein
VDFEKWIPAAQLGLIVLLLKTLEKAVPPLLRFVESTFNRHSGERQRQQSAEASVKVAALQVTPTLMQRISDLEARCDRLQQQLDEEREKRRSAERRVEELERLMNGHSKGE